MDIPTSFAGGCACGAIRYECSAAPVLLVNCHCRNCQLAGGTAFSPNVMVRRDVFLLSGEPRTYEVTVEDGSRTTRSFCGACGSPLFVSSTAQPKILGIRAASLDDSSWFQATTELWTDSALTWAHLDPRTTKFSGDHPRGRR